MCVSLFRKFFLTEAERFLTNNFNILCVCLPALIIPQAYKVTVEIKSESLEADVDTSLFLELLGTLIPWSYDSLCKRIPQIPPGLLSQGLRTTGGEQALLATALLCALRNPCSLLVWREHETWAPGSSLPLAVCCYFICSSQPLL